MFISKFKQWLDEVDPYALQRIILYKGLFVATVEVYVYWLFQPVSFQTFFLPFLLVSLYEAPVLSSFKEKEQLLIFIGAGIILVSVSFYLVYPFRGVFFFFSVLVLSAIYFFVLNYFYALKNLTMLLIATGAVVLNTNPPANLNIAYGFISSTALSITFVLISLRVFPNMYLIVWLRAMRKFIECLEEDIDCALVQNKTKTTWDEITHLGMVRNYRRMLPRQYISPSYHISVNIRNIQFSLDNIMYETMNEAFWHDIKKNLHLLQLKMKTQTPTGLPIMQVAPETKLQDYINNCLHQAFIHWNKLCSLRQH